MFEEGKREQKEELFLKRMIEGGTKEKGGEARHCTAQNCIESSRSKSFYRRSIGTSCRRRLGCHSQTTGPRADHLQHLEGLQDLVPHERMEVSVLCLYEPLHVVPEFVDERLNAHAHGWHQRMLERLED